MEKIPAKTLKPRWQLHKTKSQIFFWVSMHDLSTLFKVFPTNFDYLNLYAITQVVRDAFIC